MSIHEEMSDEEVLRALADSLSAWPVPEPPQATAVMAGGRTRQHRRRVRIGLAGTAAAAASALGLASVLAGGPAPALAAGTIHTTAFTLVKKENGTVTLTLTQGQMFNPRTLQQALAQDGIPALVTVNTDCSSPSRHSMKGVLYAALPDGSPVSAKFPIPSDAVDVINPAAIPAGMELFIDFFNNDSDNMVKLIAIDSHTCVSDPAPQLPSSPQSTNRS